MLLLIPGVFGLLVAWWKEGRSQSGPDDNEVRDRLLVALVNGLIWGSIFGAIWYFSEVSKGVHSLQLFHHSLTFEFYVPLDYSKWYARIMTEMLKKFVLINQMRAFGQYIMIIFPVGADGLKIIQNI